MYKLGVYRVDSLSWKRQFLNVIALEQRIASIPLPPLMTELEMNETLVKEDSKTWNNYPMEFS
jgi:hypothetical protein